MVECGCSPTKVLREVLKAVIAAHGVHLEKGQDAAGTPRGSEGLKKCEWQREIPELPPWVWLTVSSAQASRGGKITSLNKFEFKYLLHTDACQWVPCGVTPPLAAMLHQSLMGRLQLTANSRAKPSFPYHSHSPPGCSGTRVSQARICEQRRALTVEKWNHALFKFLLT